MRPGPTPPNDLLCMQEIVRLIKTQLRPEARVNVHPYFLSFTPRDPSLGYVKFEWEIAQRMYSVSNTPGIPREALIPEKVLPIAQWIVRQVRKGHPDWFID